MSKKPISLRFEDETLKAMDAWVERQSPLELTRSDVIRLAVIRFLEETGDLVARAKRKRKARDIEGDGEEVVGAIPA